MKEQTITQNMALFQALRRETVSKAVRFYDQRLRQLRRDARKKHLQILWLKAHQRFHRWGETLSSRRHATKLRESRPAADGLRHLSELGVDYTIRNGEIRVQPGIYEPYNPVTGCTPTGLDGKWIRIKKV
jgi:hypothetical protein